MVEPLCPSLAFWRIACIAPLDNRIVLHLEPTRPEVSCPLCGTPSGRVHRRYRRHAWDLPWSGWPVQLSIEVRHFFCDNPGCRRRIFAEPFPEVLERYARRTGRAWLALLELAHASSAERAALVARLLGFLVSPDTLIRWQLQEQFAFPPPVALGVDEFAWRRGRSYGTILVDLLRHLPIALLGEKSANSLATWLKEHPGIAVLARDRDDSYALAGRLAIPDAIQVADRFHLLRNVSEALKQLLYSRSWVTPEDGEGDQPLPQAAECTQDIDDVPKEPEPTPLKRARWQAVQEARRRGLSTRAIASLTGISRVTVRKYLQAESPPGYHRPGPAPTKLAPYLDQLRRRWVEGCHNCSQLHRELRALGYAGGDAQVRRAVQAWRRIPRSPPASWCRPARRRRQREATSSGCPRQLPH